MQIKQTLPSGTLKNESVSALRTLRYFPQGRAPPYESISSCVVNGEGSVLVELHRQQLHGLLMVKDTGSEARRQAGPAMLEGATEAASSSAMALCARSLEQQKLSATGSALAKRQVNRTNATRGEQNTTLVIHTHIIYI